MQYSLRRYHVQAVLEEGLGFFLVFLGGWSFAIVITDSRFVKGLARLSKIPWVDFLWLPPQKFPWNFIIAFLLGSALSIGILSILWSLFQVLGKEKLRREISKGLGGIAIKGYSPFHAYRRLYCLLSEKEARGSFSSVLKLDKKEQLLSTIDDRLILLKWRILKGLVFISIVISWFAGVFVFYKYVVGIVSGHSAVENLWNYFLASFRAFFHTLVLGSLAVFIGFVGYRLSVGYIFSLNSLIYDMVFPGLDDGTSLEFEKVYEILAKIEERLRKLEESLGNFIDRRK